MLSEADFAVWAHNSFVSNINFISHSGDEQFDNDMLSHSFPKDTSSFSSQVEAIGPMRAVQYGSTSLNQSECFRFAARRIEMPCNEDMRC